MTNGSFGFLPFLDIRLKLEHCRSYIKVRYISNCKNRALG